MEHAAKVLKMLLDTLAVSGDKVMKYEAMIDELTVDA